MNFKKLLQNCIASPSCITKTGVLYSINGKIVLEYMKSTKNVWVDKDIVPYILDKKEAEKEIIEFFGSVKNVYFDLELNDNVVELNDKIFNIMKQAGYKK